MHVVHPLLAEDHPDDLGDGTGGRIVSRFVVAVAELGRQHVGRNFAVLFRVFLQIVRRLYGL